MGQPSTWMGDHLGIAGATAGCKISAKTNMKGHPREWDDKAWQKNRVSVLCTFIQQVSPVSVGTVVLQDPYLLFYELQEGQQSVLLNN